MMCGLAKDMMAFLTFCCVMPTKRKVMQYIMLRGGKSKIQAIPASPADSKSIYEYFHKVLENEVNNANGVYNCLNKAFEEKD